MTAAAARMLRRMHAWLARGRLISGWRRRSRDTAGAHGILCGIINTAVVASFAALELRLPRAAARPASGVAPLYRHTSSLPPPRCLLNRACWRALRAHLLQLH